MEKDGKHDPTSTTGPADVEEGAVIDRAAEKALVRRLDWNILPLVMAIYLISFLDRVNIGNGRLFGLEKDLGLHGNQYQTCVSLLFVTYLLFEIPSNLLLKKIQPQRYLSLACISWGIVATLTGLTQNFGGLVACRLILGTLESGIFPALTLYLTFFYKRTELGFRLAFIFVSSQSAGAFGGLLGYAIGHMDGVGGMRAWRWIFILEGIPSVLLGVIVWFGLAPDSDRARYLTAAHKELQKARALTQVGYSEEGERFHWKDVRAAVRDYRTWLFGFGQYGTETMWFGFSTFLPTIIKAIGTWTSIQVQLLTIPCYVLSATAYLIMARVSDHYRLRYIFTMIFLMISIIGYALLMGDVSPGVSYLGCFFVAGGLSVSVALPLVWLPSNMPRYGKRAFGSGLQLTLGAFGGVTAPFIYVTKDSPRYLLGHGVTLALLAFSGFLFTILYISYRHANAQRAKGLEDHKLQGKTEQELNEMADESPLFVYTL
ncbi:hypothetical protein LTS07_003676 [Exophiala sideris]|uniref:Major facilitator superfamily (MFS) profile domain-containing protein n=1 Tax=Exophiala sideris TaxID=1016849 RepID=A0ABR0JIT2_9EURO|nr:hypothetical protein LTS07_003676 [Exophiala sideris]KAK5042131.1 hypothetical protein LTR13_001937 [Exophiala sideris]KAK5063918.1 hypothetical protein LTR69_003684 [Exophiala sideris]